MNGIEVESLDVLGREQPKLFNIAKQLVITIGEVVF
jgi:hypothetical protein